MLSLHKIKIKKEKPDYKTSNTQEDEKYNNPLVHIYFFFIYYKMYFHICLPFANLHCFSTSPNPSQSFRSLWFCAHSMNCLSS